MSNTLLNKNQAGEGIWTSDNLVAGSGISIQQVPQPVIDENTVAFFHFDGNTNNEINNNYTVDSSLQPFAFDSVHYKYGGYSAYPSSASYSAITSNITGISGDFTIDFWASSTGSDGLIFYANGSASYYIYPCYSDNTARIHINSSRGGSTTVDTTEFNHFAIVHKDSHPYFFINGKLVYSNTSSIYTNPTNSLKLQVPHSSKSPIFLDELRVSNVARWTSDFIPYTVPYSASAGPAQYAINNTKADPDLSSYLQNTATATNSLTINGVANTASATSVNIGDNSKAAGDQCVAIGSGSTTSNAAYANTNCVAIGFAARANYASGTAIGREATVTGTYGISIGNNAQAVNGSSVAIGAGSRSNNAAYANGNSVAVGSGARAVNTSEVAIGQGANTSGNGNGAVAVGRNAQGTGTWAIGIGTQAYATANQAIQLGYGTNNTANTFQVFNTTVVDASGKVPLASLPIVQLTQAAYDALATKDANTLYIIIPEESN